MMCALCIWGNGSNYCFNKHSAECDYFSPPAGDFLIHNASSYKDTPITCSKSKRNRNTAGKANF